MLLLIALGVGLIVLTIAAVTGKKGKGSRDLYYGFAAAAGLIALLAFVMVGPPPDQAVNTFDQQQGAAIINRFAPPFATIVGCLALGCFIGGYVFPKPVRHRRRRREDEPTQVNSKAQ